MQIDSLLDTGASRSTAGSPRQQQVRAERTLQGVFAEVLAAAGRQGYLSGTAPASPSPDANTVADANAEPEAITAAWQDWLTVGRGAMRYRDVQAPQQLFDSFHDIMLQASRQNAYAAPQAFLRGLNDQQLATVQQMHHLAQPIEVEPLTAEGAMNLLLPPVAQVDVDHDGLTESGAAYTLRFPDSRTPAAVADAWYEATADLSPAERSLREMQMKIDVVLANFHVDSQGRFSHRVAPGDPDWVNPMADPKYSFGEQTRRQLESIEYFKHQTPPEQYQRDRRFWTHFQASLQNAGALSSRGT